MTVENRKVALERRQELASFLRSRRQRLDPERVTGLPRNSSRRRTPGLRREEIATLAGVSVTWYTWLEQGRRINASRQVLSSVADALALNRTEKEYMFQLAGEVPPAPDDPNTDGVAGPYLALLEQLNPLPSFIVNGRFDVLAWNDAWAVLHPGFEQLPPQRRNTMMLIFDPATRGLYAEWRSEATRAVALFRAAAGERLVDPSFQELVRRLKHVSPDFCELWDRHEVVPSSPASRVFDHPELGRIEMGYLKMHTTDNGNTLMVHQPLPGSDLGRRLADLVDRRRRPGRHKGVASAPLSSLADGRVTRQDSVLLIS